MYADYSYYLNTYYGGEGALLEQSEAARYLKKADSYLKALLGKNAPADDCPSEVKDACCEIAECFFEAEKTLGIASESNDGYSVTYEKENHSPEKRAYEAAKRNLLHTGLLYRGVCL